MPNLRQSGKRRSVFVKTFTSYILVFTIPLLVIGIANQYLTTKIVKNQTMQNYTSNIAEVKNTMDRNLNSLNLFAVQLSKLPWVSNLMYLSENSIVYNEVDLASLIDHIRELSAYNAVNEFSDDIAIYFNRIDTLLTTEGKYNLSSFFEDIFKYENISAEQWKDKLFRYNTSDVIPPQV